MRTALTHARDWSCLAAAVAFILYVTVMPQHRSDAVPDTGAVTASIGRAETPGRANSSYSIASGTALPGDAR